MPEQLPHPDIKQEKTEWNKIKNYLLAVHEEYSDRNGLDHCKNCGVNMKELVEEIDQALDRYREATIEECAEVVEKTANKMVIYHQENHDLPELSHEDRLSGNANEATIYLADTANDVWGDDWNDAPDDCNSGTPYEDTCKGLVKTEVVLGKSLGILTDAAQAIRNLSKKV